MSGLLLLFAAYLLFVLTVEIEPGERSAADQAQFFGMASDSPRTQSAMLLSMLQRMASMLMGAAHAFQLSTVTA